MFFAKAARLNDSTDASRTPRKTPWFPPGMARKPLPKEVLSRKAPKTAAVEERSLTKQEARHKIASLGKTISDLLKERKKDKKDHLRALEIEAAHYKRDKANWKLAEEQYVIILKNKMEEIAELKEMLRGGPRKKIKQG